MFVDGLLLAVPLIVLVYIVTRAIKAIARVSDPIAHWLPDIRWLGVTMIDFVALVIFALLLTLLGAFAGSKPGQRLSAWLERVVLKKIPGFLLFKSVAGAWSNAGEDRLVPALVRFDDNTVLGFVVDADADSELITVFVPSAPTTAAGTVFLVERARVEALDVPMARAMGTVSRLGVGLQELLRSKTVTPSVSNSA